MPGPNSVSPPTYENAQQFIDALRDNRTQVIANITANDGLLRCNGVTHKITRVTSGAESTLQIAREHASTTGPFRKALLNLFDRTCFSDASKIQNQLDSTKGMAYALYKELSAQLETIKATICKSMSFSGPVETHLIRPDSILPLLKSESTQGPVTLKHFDPKGMTQQDNGNDVELTLPFHDGKSTFLIKLNASRVKKGFDGSETREAEQQADIERMKRVARGDMGPYKNTQEMMGRFYKARLIEMGTAALHKAAIDSFNTSVLLASGAYDFDAPQRPEAAETHWFAADTLPHPAANGRRSPDASTRAIESAVALHRSHFHRAAQVWKREALAAAQSGQIAKAAPAIVDRHNLSAVAKISTIVQKKLDSHGERQFRRNLRTQIGLTADDRERLKRKKKALGNDMKSSVAKSNFMQAGMAPTQSSEPGTTEVRFATQMPRLVAVARRLFGLAKAPDGGKVSSNIPWTRGLRLTKITFRDRPPAIRFKPPGPQNHRNNFSAISTGERYRSMDQLFQKLHQSIHDQFMHADVIPAVRAEIDLAVARLRADQRVIAAKNIAKGLEKSGLKENLHAISLAALEIHEINRALAAHEKTEDRLSEIFKDPARFADLPGNLRRSHALCEEQRTDVMKRTVELESRLASLFTSIGEMTPPGWLEDGFPNSSGLDAESAIADALESDLRGQLAMMRIGKATLGDFDAWRDGEVKAIEDYVASPPSADQPAPDIVEDPVPNKDGNGTVSREFDNTEEGFANALAASLTGMPETDSKLSLHGEDIEEEHFVISADGTLVMEPQ